MILLFCFQQRGVPIFSHSLHRYSVLYVVPTKIQCSASLAHPPAPGYIKDSMTFIEGLQRQAVTTSLDRVTLLSFESPFLGRGQGGNSAHCHVKPSKGLRKKHSGSKTHALQSLKDIGTWTSLKLDVHCPQKTPSHVPCLSFLPLSPNP